MVDGVILLILLAAFSGASALSVATHAIETHPVEDVLGVLALLVIGAAGWFAWSRERSKRQVDYLTRISTLQGLLSLTPTQFELAMCDLLKAQGYADVKHTGGSGDLAADIVCHDRAGNKIVVQCKRYAIGHLVSSPDMQAFIGMIYTHHRAQQGIYVTTSGYTEPARALARQHSIRAIDGDELVGLVQQWTQAYQQVPAQSHVR